MAKGQISYDQSFSIDLTSRKITEALSIISDSVDCFFAYKSGIPNELNKSALLKYDEISLNELLISLTDGTRIIYLFRGNQVILKRKVVEKTQKYLTGVIREVNSKQTIPYASVEIKHKYKGVVSDYQGNFKLPLKDISDSDTLLFSSLGYQRQEYVFTQLKLNDSLEINLSSESIQMKEIAIVFPNFLDKRVGEDAKKPHGEMYLDTQGQQTAFYIDNSDQLKGKIERLIYYLSRKGNVNAPFKVHIYSVDQYTGEPGKDLLNEFVVAKPNIVNGWFELDILLLDIDIPKNGFYIGMEGIFPDRLAIYQTGGILAKERSKKRRGKKRDIYLSELSYGQRLGFRKAKKNLTWHYSPSGKWFQLKKQSYNVMIGAKLLIEPKNKNE